MAHELEHRVRNVADRVHEQLASYAGSLSYQNLPPDAVRAAKLHIIDTLGVLLGGFFAEPSRIARNLAARVPHPNGASVIGTRIKTTVDLAACVNATTARYLEMTDTYQQPGSFGAHPSDVVTPLLAVAEHAQVSGRAFITSVVLAYEIVLRLCDGFHNEAYDYTSLVGLGTAAAAGQLLGLDTRQLSHCIAMAVVSNVILASSGGSSWRAIASGCAGRAGVLAALLARAGMEGPRLPFAGKAGWSEHVAGERVSLTTLGGDGVPFRMLDSRFKMRSSMSTTIPSVLAAEKVAPLSNIGDVQLVTVEVYELAKIRKGSGEHHWNPETRKEADHSIPYVVAATLMDGTVTPRSFNDTRLWDPRLRALLPKIQVVENDEFTRAYGSVPQQHRTRVTVVMRSGERMVGETGGDEDDIAAPKSDAQIEAKFRALAEDTLSAQHANRVLDQLWHLEDLENAAGIAATLVFA